MPPAARITDGLEHGLGLLGMIAGVAIGAALVAGTCATGGLLGAALIAGTAAGAGLIGGEAMNGLATIFNLPGIPTGAIAFMASPNVLIGGLMAARAKLDGGACNGVYALYHWPLPTALIAQGSGTVFINGQPAARAGDKLVCGGIIKNGENTVLIGGPTVTVLAIHDPEEMMKKFLSAVVLVSAVILTGGALIAGTLTVGTVLGAVALIGVTSIAHNAAMKYLPPGWNQLAAAAIDTVGLLAGFKLGEGVAEPVYPPTGEVCSMATDFVLPGALELRFDRYYTSAMGQSDWLGPNWCCSWGQRIVNTGAGIVFYFPADGRRITFELGGPADAHGWVRNPQAGDVRLRATLTGFEVRVRSGNIQRFDRAVNDTWFITGVEDRNGNFILFHYGNDHALRSVEHSGGYRLRITGTAQQITRIELEDGSDRHTLVAFSYDQAGCLSGVDNGSGQELKYEYDSAARITRWHDRKETWTAYAYDEAGRCIETSGPDGLFAYRFAYLPEDRTTVATDPYGRTIVVHYDAQGRPVAKQDQNGNLTVSVWDEQGSRGRVIDAEQRETVYEYDSDGNLMSETGPSGRTTKFEYNRAGQAIAMVDSAGKRWLREYDERGNLVLAGLEGAVPWSYTYDQFGNVIAATDPTGQVRRYGYNAAGLVLSATDCAGNVTTYQRNAFGQILSKTDALGHETQYFFNAQRKLDSARLPNGAELYWVWDVEGNLIERVGAKGDVYRYTYGPYDKLTSIERPSGAVLHFDYDAEARLSGVTNERQERWHYEYDNAGRLIGEKDFSGRVQLYQYDRSGLLIERTNGNGEKVSLSRGPSGEILEKSSADGKTEFAYDANGMLAVAKNDSITVGFVRDEYGRVLQEVQGSHTVQSWFDGRGLRTKRRVNGQETLWRYDANGRVQGLSLQEDEWMEFTRDVVGQNTQRRLTRGLEEETPGFLLQQEFDPMRNLRVQQTSGEGVLLNERRLQYDAGGSPNFSEELLWGKSEFGYNADGRLESVERSRGPSEGFLYNSAGEIAGTLTQEHAGGAAEEQTVFSLHFRYLGQGGRLESIDQTTFKYDADGRTTEKRKGNQVWRYEWTVEGQLRAVVVPTGERWVYEYDPFGRRVRKSGPGSETTYVWDGGVVAEEIRVQQRAAVLRSSWHFEPSTFRPLAKVENGKTYACVLDQVGTPRELVSSDGKLAWSARFTAFGEVETLRESGTDCPIRFQGQWFDEESGLHYNWKRYYEPESGTYLSSDPVGLGGGSRSYGYVHNPLAWIDPLGLAGCAVTPEQGSIDYGTLDALGRPTGVRATITPDMIGTGTSANPNIEPPGWGGDGTALNQARGHLLGKQLGGSGDVPENLVTLQQNPTNSPVMRGFENQVRSAVEGGQTVDYTSTPIYDGSNPIPRAVTMTGTGSDGFNLGVSVLNPPGMP